MTSYFAIVAPPRSGTKWFANLFTAGDTFCFHELWTLTQGWPTREAHNQAFRREARGHSFEQLQRRMYLDAYPTYFARLMEHGERGRLHVGNSDNGLTRHAAGMWLVWPSTKFVFSVRNGINQVNSAVAGDAALAEVARALRPSRFAGLSAFDVACRQWALHIEGWSRQQSWLRERDAPFITTTLERVTTDEAELERVWSWVAGDWEDYRARAISLMRRPVNERVNAAGSIRTPESIWGTWSDADRATFVAHCGATQEALGYSIPSSPHGP
jgi:hypothetical protein